MHQPQIRGPFHFVFERQPLIQKLILQYGFLFSAGYFGVVALASVNDVGLLETWMALWRPLVDLLSAFFPNFWNIENRINKSFAASISPVVVHLLAVGWTMVAIGVCATTALAFSSRRKGIVRLASQLSRARLIAIALTALIFIAALGALFIAAPIPALGIRSYQISWTSRFVIGATAAGVIFYTISLMVSTFILVSAALLAQRKMRHKH